MPINRDLLTAQLVSKAGATPFLCPTCQLGHFEITASPPSLQTRKSREHEELLYGPEDYWEGLFAGLLQCGNSSCREVALFSGTEKASIDRTCPCPECEDREGHWYTVLSVDVLQPAPLLISLPKNTPSTLAVLVHKACAQLWADPAAALNSVRMALEVLTEHFGISPYKKNGGYQPLRNRLEELAKMPGGLPPRAQEIAAAIRWLGNEGSHVNESARSDACDALDLLESVLHVVFSTGQLDARVKAINEAQKFSPIGG